MPMAGCKYFYDCNGCGAVPCLKPEDCCVFRSYGDVISPPVQIRRSRRQ